MSKKHLKQFLLSVATASAVAAINYTIFHSHFVFVVLMILIAHELGHYITARMNGAKADLPYFIPFPIISIGITHIKNMKFLSKSTRKKILAYGPITGFITAFYFLLLSLLFSSLPSAPLLFICFSELVFNYFGSDGKKYRQIKEQELSLCIS